MKNSNVCELLFILWILKLCDILFSAAAGGSVAEKFTKGLMEELICPICREHMHPPIMMCHNGHNICHKCRCKHKKCPTCRKPFLKVRNVALEKLAQKMGTPCHYAQLGCKQTLSAGESDDHLNLCVYRPYICPLSIAEKINCTWSQSYCKLKAHIEEAHKDRLTKCQDDERKVVMKSYNPTRKYSRIIFVCGEVFYQEFYVVDNMFYFVIQHVGPRICASKYRYTFSLSTHKSIEVIFIAFIARSYMVNVNDIIQAGQCVKLDYNTVKNFLEPDGTLVFSFSIKQANDKGRE